MWEQLLREVREVRGAQRGRPQELVLPREAERAEPRQRGVQEGRQGQPQELVLPREAELRQRAESQQRAVQEAQREQRQAPVGQGLL